jgi:methylase of polypeptide subunit release factors
MILEKVQVHIRGEMHEFDWRSSNGSPAPKKITTADDTLTADQALKWVKSGVSILWRGDFHNARQLLQALSKRVTRELQRRAPPAKGDSSPQDLGYREQYEDFRQQQKRKAELLGRLLLAVGAGHTIDLRRAPRVDQACEQAFGANAAPYLLSFRELSAVIGAHEWRKKGVQIDLTQAGIKPFKLEPHFGVFSPIRGEYLELIAKTPLPASLAQSSSAFDIGCGTGVVSLILAKRGVRTITATDVSERALQCTRTNVELQGLRDQIQVLKQDLYPADQKASLIVCNPPWLPSSTSGSLDSAVFDPNSQMLKGYLNLLKSHLNPQGEGWLVMSSFAELLGLRAPEQLEQWIAEAGLVVLGKTLTRPVHKKTQDTSDPFYALRSQEVTSLWRLAAA